MGLFIRKSIKVGKFGRINLSKHGVGYSVGVKGARIGKSSTGQTYVSGGRDGIYFKENLKGGNSPSNQNIKAMPSPARLKPKVWPYVIGVIATLFLSGLFKSVTLFWVLFVIISVAYFGFVIYKAIKTRT